MGKYIKQFATQAAYTAAQANLDLPNVSLITENMTVEFNPYVAPVAPRLDIIIYEASAKLTETTDYQEEGEGLHTNVFNTTIKSHTFENGVGIIEFNDNVTSIGGFAFGGCDGLTSVTIPNGVTSIGEYAFGACNNLTSINIPSGVTSIGENAFGGIGLTSIIIPSSVTSIGYEAFMMCHSLTSVTVNATTPPTLGNSAFYGNASGRKIYVPSGSVNTYKRASGWSDYKNDIYAIGS